MDLRDSTHVQQEVAACTVEGTWGSGVEHEELGACLHGRRHRLSCLVPCSLLYSSASGFSNLSATLYDAMHADVDHSTDEMRTLKLTI